ncbi:MAG: V-type ATP synthase subunit I [Treponema sp.]|nr:V-type ATP synthase subunit I [Treponema sp.]
MILPMKKVCLMVQEKTSEDALIKLRKLGVLHLEKKNVPLDVNSNALKNKTKVEDAMGLIQDFKPPKKKKQPAEPYDSRNGRERRKVPVGMHRGRRATDVFGTDAEAPYSIEAVRAPKRPYLPDLLNGFGDERKALKEQNTILSREVSRIQGWGDFNPAGMEEIINYGIPVYLYEISPEVFEHLNKDVQYIKIKSDKSVIRIAVFENKIPDIAPFQLPKKRVSEIFQDLDANKIALKKIEDKLSTFADRRPALNKEMAKVMYDLEFETAAAGMESVENIPAGSGLSWLSGYAPDEDIGKIKKKAEENGWALSIYQPAKDDEKVPTKLKNNKFVSLLKPITGFLEIVPGYREYDISPFFLFFFCIFFSMIYGDAGYGMLLSLTAVFGIISMISKKKNVPLALQMLLLLGICNTTWGTLTCSWFAVEVEKVPQFLKDISLSYISNAKTTDQRVIDQNMQLFCFTLGLVHLSVAHIVNMFRCKSLRILGELGQIAMLVGMYNVVLFLIVSNEVRRIELNPVSIYLIAGGFLFNFLFSSYQKSMGQAIMSSLKNIMSVILGIVNIFSDIMSYIRLWAVGLAGAAIAGTVNSLAGPALGSFLIFAGIILLIFGHGMNIVLNVLSVLVHGVRLNTLEFSGHVGLTWSGTAYKPFAEKVIK